jgi:hypothetical protein
MNLMYYSNQLPYEIRCPITVANFAFHSSLIIFFYFFKLQTENIFRKHTQKISEIIIHYITLHYIVTFIGYMCAAGVQTMTIHHFLVIYWINSNYNIMNALQNILLENRSKTCWRLAVEKPVINRCYLYCKAEKKM